MKRVFTSIVSLLAVICANSQTITITAEVSETERTFQFCTLADKTPITIDWGDGQVVEGCEGIINDGYDTTVKATGTVKGEGVIKIYGEGITYFDCVSRVDGASITHIDLSNAKDLEKLYANGNVRLTAIDLTPCTKLTTVDLSNDPIASIDLSKCVNLTSLSINGTAETPCALTEIDLSNNTLLKSIKLNYNNIKSIDISNNQALTGFYCLNNGLENIVLPEVLPACTYFSVNNNSLTSFDASCFTAMSASKGSIFLLNNELKEATNLKGKSVNISKNYFTISTMPDATNVKTLTYVPQKDMTVAETVGKSIDLSSEYDGGKTTYALYYEDNSAVDAGDYTVEKGIITFNSNLDGKKLYVSMTSSTWAKFTGTNALKTTVFAIDTSTGIDNVVESIDSNSPAYNLQGQRTGIKSKGIIIQNGRKFTVK